jgi:predicted dehydrogenase
MVDEWQKHDVQFGICFGLHYSPNVMKLKELINDGALGDLKQIQARTAQGSWNHIIDMVRFLGGEVEEVFAFADDKEDMDNKAACLRFEGGLVGTLAVSRHLGLQFQIKWMGDGGDAWADNIAGTTSWRPKGKTEVTTWDDGLGLQAGTYYVLFEGLIEEFVACIKEKRPFVADGWAGLRHMEIDGAITESIRTGKPVRIERYRPEKGRTIKSG